MRTLGIPVHSRLMGRVGIRTWRHRHIFNIKPKQSIVEKQTEQPTTKEQSSKYDTTWFPSSQEGLFSSPFPQPHSSPLSLERCTSQSSWSDTSEINRSETSYTTERCWISTLQPPAFLKASFLLRGVFFIISNSFHLTSNWALWQRGWSSSICTCSLANRGSAGRSLH